MSDRIAVMSSGVALQVGGPGEIYERPNCKFVADFIGETNFLDGTVCSLPAGRSAEIELAQGVRVRADLTPDQSLINGQRVTVAVRPEKLHLSEGHPEANRVRGRVEEVVYIGTDTQYGVRLVGGQKVRVRAQNHDPFSRPAAAAGEQVTVTFVPQAARVLVD